MIQADTNINFPEKLAPLFEPHRYKILHGGRGGAKSWGVARWLIIAGAQTKLRILCAREVQKSIKDSVHKLISDQIESMGYGAHYQILDNEIRGNNGTEFIFAGLGGLTVESIKSYEGVDKVWVEEGQTVRKRSWDILIPTIRKDGSEIIVTLNPELDTDDTYVRFIETPPDDSVVIQINYPDNPWFPDVLEQERLHCHNTDRESYDNIWEGKCRKAVAGAIYPHEVGTAITENRMNRPVPYDPMLKVHCIWDLGFNDSMAIIMVQRVASELRIIRYMEDSHHTLEWYVLQLKKLDYNWGLDWLPHDGYHKDYKTGKSAEEILIALGRDLAPGDSKDPAIPNIRIEDGIKHVRTIFPRCYFDKDHTKRLQTCLKRYRRHINIQTQEPGPPLHDEFSHGADDFRYLSLVADKLQNDLTTEPYTLPPPPDPYY